MTDRVTWFAKSDEPAVQDFWQVYAAHFAEISASPRSEFARRVIASAPEEARRAMLEHIIGDGHWDEQEERLRKSALVAYDAGVSLATWHELCGDFGRTDLCCAFHSDRRRKVYCHQNARARGE